MSTRTIVLPALVAPKAPRTFRFDADFRRQYPAARAFLAPQDRKARS